MTSSFVSTFLALSVMIPLGMAIGFLYVRCATDSEKIIRSAHIASFILVMGMLFATVFVAPISLFGALILALGISVPWILAAAGAVGLNRWEGLNP